MCALGGKEDIKICRYLKREHMLLDLKATGRDEAIRAISELLKGEKALVDPEGFVSHILERENMDTTGIGQQFAIPHARTDAVKGIVIAFGRSSRGIDFQSIDGEPVKLIFLIGAPEDNKQLHAYLKILSRLSRLLDTDDFRNGLLKAETKEDILDLFVRAAVFT